MFLLLIQAPNLEGPPKPLGPFETAEDAAAWEEAFREANDLPREHTEGLWTFDLCPLPKSVEPWLVDASASSPEDRGLRWW